MATIEALTQVSSQPGRPLYLSVRDAVRTAIDTGVFQPGQQMPSTKLLSEQMSVSLVTAHRAMRELVASGVLRRTQGKGTFVHQSYFEKDRDVSLCRLGLGFSSRSFHCRLLPLARCFEGVRQAANELAVDLMLLRFDEDLRNECGRFSVRKPTCQRSG